jgi:uncharacterized protein YmfQ (DUF2313 family)
MADTPRNPPQGNLSASRTAPTRVVNTQRTPPQGNFSLTRIAPTVYNGRTPTRGNLALSRTAPSISTSRFPAGDLRISSRPPICQVDSTRVIAPIIHTGDRHVRRDGDAYAQSLTNLLPTGVAWPRDADRTIMRAISGLAQIFGFVDRRAADLLEIESDPRTTVELLTDWERNWGLPDHCFLGVGQTLDERRKFLVLKMTLEGGQSREWFIWVAAQLGYDVSITEFAPFMCGISHCGDTRPSEQAVNRFVGDLMA